MRAAQRIKYVLTLEEARSSRKLQSKAVEDAARPVTMQRRGGWT
jgi:hypothetical protein